MGSFDRLRFPDACSAIIKNEKEEILLVKIKFKGGRWQLPGGLIEKGESPWEACEERMLQEIGVKSKINKLVGVFFRPEKDANIFIFQGSLVNGAPFKNSEDIEECQYFPIDALPKELADHTLERIKICFNANNTVFKKQS